MRTICLITNGHISSDPRIVKEADTLQETGYRTIVIGTQYMPDLIKYDELLVQSRPWIYEKLIWTKEDAPILYLKTRLRHYFFRILPSFLWPSLGIAEKALGRLTPELIKKASLVKADLYIAHNLAALPVAAKVARKYNAKLGFDAEDFHSGESLADDKAVKLAEFIEKKYLNQCDYITAASEFIAQAYAERYKIKEPTTVLNVFPLSMIQDMPRQDNPGLLLYWFSQNIGIGRGIEDVIMAMGRTKQTVRLYLQGRINPRYKTKLVRLALKNKVGQDRLIFLEISSQDDLFKIASRFDVGLALEKKEPLSKHFCIPNKILTYLLAGLSVIATDTKGQRSVIERIGRAGWMYKNGDIDSLVKRLEFLLENKQELDISKQESLKQAREIYNWDLERNKFLNIINEVLS